MPLFESIEQNNIQEKPMQDWLGQRGYDELVEENNKKLEAQKQEHNLWVQNIVSPEKVAEWKNKGAMSALEVWNRKERNELVPYMSTIQQADKGLRIKKISDDMRKGLYISPDDKAFYEQFVLDMAEIQTRGYTFGGGAVNIGLETFPFMVEFGAGLLTSGGVGSVGATVAKVGVKKAAKDALEGVAKKAAEDGVFKTFAKGTGKLLYDSTLNPRTLAFTATRLPQQVKARYADIMLSDSLAISEEGQAILLEAKEKPAIAFLKALGLTQIEVGSEMAGATLLKPLGVKFGKYVAPKVLNKLPEKLASKLEKVAKEVTGMPLVKGVEALGFNGLIEEIGEERVGDILRFAFNLDEKEGYSFEQFLEAAFPSFGQVMQEAVAFGAMGVGAGVVNAGLRSASERYSKDEFLLDAGIFRQEGRDSLLDSQVRSKLEEAGVPEEDIENTLQFGTREQKLDFVRNNINTQSELSKEIETDWYNKLVEAGAQHEQAYRSAKLMSVFIDRFGADEKVKKQWYDKLVVTNKKVEEGKKIALGQAQFQTAASAGANENEVAEAEKEYAEKGTESKYFKKWFGKSKVVDENGKPLVVYHGSLWKFDTFGKSDEFDFSLSSKFAYEYAAQKSFEQALDLSPVLYSVYLKAENPFDFRDEKSVNELLEKIGDKEINFWGNKYSHEKFKDLIMGLSYENTVKNQEVFDKAEVGMAYSRYNEDVEEKMSSVADAKIVYKNKDYFVALDEINEPRRSPFSSEPAGRVDRDDVYKQVEKLAKDIDFADEYIKKITLNTNLVKTTYEVGKGYVDEYTPYELTVRLRKVDNPKIAKKGAGYDNWSFFETTKIGDTYFLDFLKENGYDSYYKQEKEQLNISVFNPEQIKSVDNRGTFDADNANIYYQKDKYLIDDEGKREIQDYKNFVNKVFDNKLTKKEKSKQYVIGETPAALIDAGISSDKLAIGFSVIEKAKNEKNNDHKLSRTTIENIIEALYNPIAIVKDEVKSNEKSNNRYAVILDLKQKENFVMVSIDSGKNIGSGNLVNDIRTVHSRESFAPMIDRAVNSNRLLKIKKSKLKDLLLGYQSDFVSEGGQTSLIDIIEQKYENLNILFQSAWHGGAVNFDKFDLSFALSGEGAMAHGWGVYLAQNRDVSEGYREKLIANTSFTYEGKTYFGEETFGNALYKIKNYGKDKAIEFFQDKEQEFRDEAKTSRNPDWWNKEADKFKKVVEQIKNVDESKIEENKGQLYEVDIPENDVLLDEDLPFNEQPEKVKNGILQIFKEKNPADIVSEKINWFDNMLDELEQKAIQDGGYTTQTNYARDMYENKKAELENLLNKLNNYSKLKGKDIYKILSVIFEGDKEASLLLNEYGIKGITYDGMQDGRCYVIFDDKAVKILNTFYQEEGEINNNFHDLLNRAREKKEQQENEYYGYFVSAEDKNVLSIMQNHNASTIIHEMGHLFLDGLNEFAKVDSEAAEQLAAVNKWLGSDGVYTVAQQEKFARSFEAYLYRGKAPSSMLRKVFEAFKEWMKKIYLDITSIHDADISDEAVEVFDRIFYGNEYAEKNKQIKQLLNKIKTLRADDELTDTQKRHRDIAYHIVSLATGKDEKYLKRILENKHPNKSVKKQQENIEFLLEKTDDKISTKEGFLPEWLEFFDEAELYEDETKLAFAAYNTILAGNYRNDTTFIDEDYLSYLDAQYNYILKEYQKLPHDRDVVLGAYYEWLGSINEEYQENYAERFNVDIEYIERRENMDKFERAKADILSTARSAKNPYSLNTVEVYKDFVLSVMKNLDFLQPIDKARLTTNILENTSVAMLEARIDNILDIAKTMEDLAYRRELVKKIRAELQGTKNVKQGARTVGKYDYKTNKLFERLRELDNLSVEQANDMRLSEEMLMRAQDEGLSFEDKMINRFLTFKANGNTYGTTENIKALFDDIVKIKNAARDAKNEQEMFDKLNLEKNVQELIDIVEAKKEPKAVKWYMQLLGNWESSLNALFNKDIKDKYSLLLAETAADVWIYEQKKRFEDVIAGIYGLNSWNFDKELLKGLSEEYTFNERVRDYDKDFNLIRERIVEKKMNRLEVLLAYIWNKNELMRKRLINMFGEDTLDEMFEVLSVEDKNLGDFMVRMASGFYPEVNEAFIKKYGLDLPKISAYFPSRAEREGSEVDMFNDFTSQTKNDSFTKNRTKSETIALEFGNPIEMLYSHIDGVGKFVYMGERLDKLNKIFKNKTLKRTLKNKYGNDVYKSLFQTLTNITYKAAPPVYSLHGKILNNVISNWIQGNVIFRPIVGLKQLLAANNYAADMPYLDWHIGYLKAIANFKSTIDYMTKIPYLKARFGGSGANEFLKDTINNSAFAASKKFKDLLAMNIKMGDIGAIVFGGKPYIDYLIKQGKTEEEAIEQFVLMTQRTQQSSAISSLSNFQVAMSRNPIGKLFTAYKNSPYQYIRMCGDAIVSVANGDMTLKECAKIIYHFAYVQPLLYTLATSGSILTWLATGDDDELKADLFSTLFNLNADALAFVGDAYKFAIEKLILKEKYMPSTTPLLGDLQMEIMKLSKKEVSAKDYFHAAGYGVHLLTGVDANAVGNSVAGLGDIAKGDVAKGTLRAVGYTENRAKRIVGEKDKKKK